MTHCNMVTWFRQMATYVKVFLVANWYWIVSRET
jgi:hypothetical protein